MTAPTPDARPAMQPPGVTDLHAWLADQPAGRGLGGDVADG